MSINYFVTDKTNLTPRSAAKVDTLTVAPGATGIITITENDEFWIGHIDIAPAGGLYDISVYANFRTTPVMDLIYTATVGITTTVYKYFFSLQDTFYKKVEVRIKNSAGVDSTYYYFIPTAYNQGIPLRKF